MRKASFAVNPRGPKPRPPKGPGWRRRAWSNCLVVATVMAALLGLAYAPVGVPASRVFRVPRPRPEAVRLVVSSRGLGVISRYLFGSNLLWPYDAEGAYDQAEHEFYPSFVKEVRALGISALRYPGGITSDSFDWLRAIGPEDRRLLNEPYSMQAGRLSRVCCTLDGPAPSTVGPDEFGQLLAEVGAIGTITVNFVTGTPKEAADWVAYMTAPLPKHPCHNPEQAGYWAELRAKNGHPSPYDVPWWEVGNEQDGPGQFGWRSGSLVSIGPHRVSRAGGRCQAGEAFVCLYAFGGTTYFSHQPVGTFADTYKEASFSKGLPDERFYAYFPPVVPGSEKVFVGSEQWRAVRDLAAAGPLAHVFTFVPANGEITFGNGLHGAIPPRGKEVTISYESGPHGGFVEFYRAMKAMNPHIHICESEESNVAFLQVMGTAYPYDCVELHEYAKPLDVRAPMTRYEEGLLSFPQKEGQEVTALQRAIRHYARRHVPIALTEYGQLVVPMPIADPDFNLSLDEALLVASQLRQWVDHGLPLAEKYLLDSTPFLERYRLAISIDEVGLSIDSAMIAGPGPPFVVEPTGLVLALMSHLAGAQRLYSHVQEGPVMEPAPGERVPVLQSLAAWTGKGIAILVINASPLLPVRALVDLGKIAHGSGVVSTVLDGPSPLAYNDLAHPNTVRLVTRHTMVPPDRNFSWTFPDHSVTLLQLSPS
jgi:alpha-N-arabinofuranosidase